MQSPSTPGRPAPELRDYVATLRLRKWYVIGVVLAVVVAALLYTYLRTPVYTAQTQVLVQMPSAASAQLGQPPTPDMDTERAIAMSPTVASSVASELGLDQKPTELLRHVSVTVPAGTQLLQFSFTDPDPDTARRAADAFAQDYLDMRRQRFEQDVQSAVTPIDEQLRTLRAALRSMDARAAAAHDPAKRAALTDRANSLVTQIGLLQQRRLDIAGVPALSIGEVTAPAAEPTHPSNRQLLLTISLALAVGLILGVAAALARDRLDDRLRSETEVEERSGARTLATVPKIQRAGSDGPEAPLPPDGSDPVLADAFRSLRTSFLFALRGAGTRVVLVTSPEGGDGKTTVAANLASSLAHAGDRIVLVAADLRRPALSAVFGVDGERGLAAALRREVDVRSVITATNVPNLSIVSAGRIEPDDIELLRPDRLREMFDRLARDNDLVLLDGPPVLGVPDTLSLAAAADAALLVVDAKRTTRGAIDRAVRQLALVDAVILGEVVNNTTASDLGYYRSSDGYARAAATPPREVEAEGNGAG